MYNFTFNIPTKIHFGKDTISNLSAKAYGSKVLLVYGGGSIKKKRSLTIPQ